MWTWTFSQSIQIVDARPNSSSQWHLENKQRNKNQSVVAAVQLSVNKFTCSMNEKEKKINKNCRREDVPCILHYSRTNCDVSERFGQNTAIIFHLFRSNVRTHCLNRFKPSINLSNNHLSCNVPRVTNIVPLAIHENSLWFCSMRSIFVYTIKKKKKKKTCVWPFKFPSLY